jgi:hypothetical protein
VLEVPDGMCRHLDRFFKDIFFVVVDLTGFEHASEFVQESFPLVMLLLVFDVFGNCADFVFAVGKAAKLSCHSNRKEQIVFD